MTSYLRCRFHWRAISCTFPLSQEVSSHARSYTHRPRTLFPTFHLVLNVLTFPDTVKVESLKAAAVEKHFLLILPINESKTTVTDDFLNRAFHASPRLSLDLPEKEGIEGGWDRQMQLRPP